MSDSLKLLNKSKLSVVMQRIPKKFSYDSNNKSDPVNPHDIEMVNRSINSRLSINISDNDFRLRCKEAKNKCKNYIYVFFLMEKISNATGVAATIFSILVANYKLSVHDILWIVLVMFLVTILDSFGEWGRLREKYSRIHHHFKILANSHDEDRIIKFRKYAEVFGGDQLFIDSIILSDFDE